MAARARIPDLIDSAAEAGVAAPALIAGNRYLGFADLAQRSRSIAAGLAAEGVRAGDVVLLWLPNEPAWLETFFACARLGAICFAVNTRFRAADVAEILDRARPRAVVYRPRFRTIAFDGMLADAVSRAVWRPPLAVSVAADGAEGALLLDDLAAAPPFGGRLPEPRAGAVLFTTSGTTSRPKYVLHAHRSIAAHAGDVARDFGMDAADAVMLQALPYSGVFGFCQAMAALAAGRPSVSMAAFDAADAIRLIGTHAITHFNATDDMLAALAEAEPGADAYRSLRLVGAASFNRGPDALAQLARGHGLPVVGLYGMSEIQALYARRALDDPDDVRFLGGGRPVSAAAAVRVRDPETGGPAGADGAGELECAGPSLFSGYYGDDEATAAARTADGFVRTGDFGAAGRDGGFTFESRMGDTLRLGGYLVNPAEIGEFIASRPGVAGCQVVGVPVDGRMRAAAFVIAEAPGAVDTGRLLADCRAELARFKVPALVHELAEFPVVHSANGIKIRRATLRDLAKELIELNC